MPVGKFSKVEASHALRGIQKSLAEQKRTKTLAANVRSLWVKMCKHDGIEPDAMFVVFSKENPYAVDYNNAMADLMNDGKVFGVVPARR